MRQHLAKLGLAISVGGCSLIYNPNNISKPSDAKEYLDAPPPDSEIIVDANPMAISVDSAFPTTIDEGQGAGNGTLTSPPAVISIVGTNFVPTATVTFAPASAVTLVEQKVAADHKFIVVAVTVPVDTACAAGGTIPVNVTVSEPDGAGGMAMNHLDSAFTVACLNELTTATANLDSNTLAAKYSKIDLSTGITFKADTSETPKAILRSMSFINIGGAVDASASGQNSGPGGGRGGAGGNPGAAGNGPGHGGGGAAGLAGSGGGGAGFAGAGGAGSGSTPGTAGAMTGDAFLASYTANRGSGGGGGGNTTLGNGGGAGGGGGGTVELTARGGITVGNITAKGGDSTTGGGDGGAGAGGVILVRSGSMLTMGTPSVAAGTPPSGGNGGTASVGRIRVDSAKGAQGGTSGPMFVDPPVTTSVYPQLTLRGLANDHTSLLEVLDKDGNIVDNGHLYTPAFAPNGTAQVMPVLKIGYNRVCVLVQGNNDPNVAEGTNCIEIGYAP